MRQVTGNSSFAEPSRELSIQITLGGFSFSVSQNGKFLYGSQSNTFEFESIIGDSSRYTAVIIGWSCDTVLLIPASIFEPEMVASYLLAANLTEPTTSSLWNNTLDSQISAAWSVDCEILDEIERLYPNAYHYHNLQVDVQCTEQESVRISVTDSIANVVVSTRDGLYAAEAIRFSSAEDLLFFVTKINMIDKFARHSMEFIAADTEQYRGLFNRYFAKAEYVTDNNFYHSKILRCEL